MKKQKKQKLLNVWNKLKKPLVILSFVGNILFLIFVIVGCVGVKKKSTQTKADNNDITFLSGTSWEHTNEIITTPAGVGFDSLQNDEIYFFTIDGYLPTSYPVFVVNGYYESQIYFNAIHFQNCLGTGYNGNMDVEYAMFLEYRSPGNPGIEQHKTLFYYIDNHRDPHYGITSVDPVIKFVEFDNLVYSDLLLPWFKTYFNAITYNQSEYTFLFEKNFNYNAPYKADANSPFCTSSGTGLAHIEISFQTMFFSAGQQFNKIKLYYLPGYGTTFKDSSNITQTCERQDVVYFLEMEYINTFTSSSVVVNYRNFDVSNTITLVNSSYWINDSYRLLTFQYDITNELKDSLTQFNGSLVNSNGFSQVGGDVGLGNVFSLISSGFGAFINVMKIEILPGLSIGLLCFLPLILVVIMVIIKLVKR